MFTLKKRLTSGKGFYCNAFVIIVVTLSPYCFGQDTIRLKRKPTVILRSWYPEYKNNPHLNVGESKIVFSIIRGQGESRAQSIPLILLASSIHVNIQETGKSNQFLIKADSAGEGSVELTCWWNLGNKIVLLKHKNHWVSVNSIFPSKGNQVLIDRKRLKIR